MRATWKNCTRDVHEEGWREVGGKSSLKWSRLAKQDFEQERYVKEFGSKGEVRLRIRLRNVSDVMKVLWKILYISCCTGEFAGDRGRLLGMIEGIDGTEEWMDEWRNKCDEGRIGLLLGRSVAWVKKKVPIRIHKVVTEKCAQVVEEEEIADVWHLGPCLWHPHPSPFLPRTSQSFLGSFLVQIIHNINSYNAISYLFIIYLLKSLFIFT